MSNGNHDVKNSKNNKEKSAYSKPSLRVFGSVTSLTMSGGSQNNDAGGSMSSTMMSDRKLKTNVVRVGAHPMGFGLYLFHYKDEFLSNESVPRRFGVMADEVEIVVPQAVLRRPDGFKMVDYGMIGINLAD